MTVVAPWFLIIMAWTSSGSGVAVEHIPFGDLKLCEAAAEKVKKQTPTFATHRVYAVCVRGN